MKKKVKKKENNYNEILLYSVQVIGFFFFLLGLFTIFFVGSICSMTCPTCTDYYLYHCSNLLIFIGIIFIIIGFVLVNYYPAYIY